MLLLLTLIRRERVWLRRSRSFLLANVDCRSVVMWRCRGVTVQGYDVRAQTTYFASWGCDRHDDVNCDLRSYLGHMSFFSALWAPPATQFKIRAVFRTKNCYVLCLLWRKQSICRSPLNVWSKRWDLPRRTFTTQHLAGTYISKEFHKFFCPIEDKSQLSVLDQKIPVVAVREKPFSHTRSRRLR